MNINDGKFSARVCGLVWHLDDGRELTLVAQLFNWRVAVGPAGAPGYDSQW
jgi:hypothetical protein